MDTKKALISAAVSGLMGGLLSSSTFANTSEKASLKDKEEIKGECHGVNACKGQGACGGAGHSCAGKNACKGKSWITSTKAECDAQKGTFKGQSIEERHQNK